MPLRPLDFLSKLRQGPSLMDDAGNGFTPRPGPGLAGMDIRQWGHDQAVKANFARGVEATQNPNKMVVGSTSLVPTDWEAMGHVIRGRRNAVEGAGGRFRGDDYGNMPAPNTRFDENQIGVTTGETMGTDISHLQQAMNGLRTPSHGAIANLRRKFGL